MNVVGVYSLANLEQLSLLDFGERKARERQNPIVSKLKSIHRFLLSRSTEQNTNYIENNEVRAMKILFRELDKSIKLGFDELYRKAAAAFNKTEISLKIDDLEILYKSLCDFYLVIRSDHLLRNTNSLTYLKLVDLMSETIDNFENSDIEDFLDIAGNALDKLEKLQTHKILIDLFDISVFELEKYINELSSPNSTDREELNKIEWLLPNAEMENLSQDIKGKFCDEIIVKTAKENYGMCDLQVFIVEMIAHTENNSLSLNNILQSEISLLLIDILRPKQTKFDRNDIPNISNINGRLLINFTDKAETGCPLALDDGFEIKFSHNDDSNLYDCDRKYVDFLYEK